MVPKATLFITPDHDTCRNSRDQNRECRIFVFIYQSLYHLTTQILWGENNVSHLTMIHAVTLGTQTGSVVFLYLSINPYTIHITTQILT